MRTAVPRKNLQIPKQIAKQHLPCRYLSTRPPLACATRFKLPASGFRNDLTKCSPAALRAVWWTTRSISSQQKAKDLNQQGIDEQMSEFDDAIAEEREKQIRAPWQREGADTPPVKRQRSAGAMTKGRWTFLALHRICAL